MINNDYGFSLRFYARLKSIEALFGLVPMPNEVRSGYNHRIRPLVNNKWYLSSPSPNKVVEDATLVRVKENFHLLIRVIDIHIAKEEKGRRVHILELLKVQREELQKAIDFLA